jgi:hypothetical protein
MIGACEVDIRFAQNLAAMLASTIMAAALDYWKIIGGCVVDIRFAQY